MKKEDIDFKLQRYLDGELSPEETAMVEAEVSRSAEWARQLSALKAVNLFLAKSASLQIPSKNFTQKVMNGLETQTGSSWLSPKNGILLLLGVIVASGLVIALISNGAFNQMTSVDINSTSLLNRELPKISVPFNMKLIIQGILVVNAALAFIVLDRTVLRPFFQKRAMGF